MEPLNKHNIFSGPAACGGKEFFETIVAAAGFLLERIVSTGQTTPPGQWLKQDTHEWVILLSGSAHLTFYPSSCDIHLLPGDHILIPAGSRHRVEWTDPKNQTVWLALHYPWHIQQEGQTPTGIKNVKVIRTRRRSSSATARMAADTLYVRVPYRISDSALKELIKEFTLKIEKKLLKKQLNSNGELSRRAAELNRKYFSGKLSYNSIEYVTGQNSQFGCCDYAHGKIRIAHHVAFMPEWVRDYVIVHELAHLMHHGHGPDFWGLVRRYPYMERAKGYLLAKGYELNDKENQRQNQVYRAQEGL